MKKILAGITVFTIFTTVGWAQQGSVGMNWSADPSTTMHNVFISKHTTKEYLDSVSAAWKKDGIVLQFTELKYNAGGLTTVKGTVRYKSGNHPKGTFSKSNLKKGIDIRIDNSSVSINGE